MTGVGRNQRLLRSGGSAFGTLADRRLVHFVIGVWIVRCLARSLFCSLSSFFLWLSLFFTRVRKMFEGKMIL